MYHLISDKLKEAMLIKNVNLPQLAEMSDISLSTLQNLYYAKNKNPRVETLYALCKALDVTMDYITGLTKYDKNELEMLRNYQTCGRHGKDFLLIVSRFESDYTTSLKRNQKNKHVITCLIPEGHVADGFVYSTCKMEQVETVFDEAFMAIKITTDNFIPSFLNGDIIALANRFPIEGEKAVYYKDGRAYFREYNRELNGTVVLKTLNGIGEDFVLNNMSGFKLLGTYINVIRWQ